MKWILTDPHRRTGRCETQKRCPSVRRRPFRHQCDVEKDGLKFLSSKFGAVIYVLHAFQKKSKTGSKTPATDLALIARRLKVAEADYKARVAKGK